MTLLEQPFDAQFFALQEALAGKYSLEAELGRGGMGIVYLAQEVQLDRPVALKVLPQELSSKAGLRERFLREARTAAKLSHPNIIPIFAVDAVGEFVYFAMAYVAGDALPADLRDARETTEKHLAEAVASLETIRLGLLRLTTGTGTVDGLTADLAAAADVGDEIDRLMAGMKDVELLLRPT